MSTPTNAELLAMLETQQKRFFELLLSKQQSDAILRELQHRFTIMESFFVREFPKYFAGDAPLVFAPNGEQLADDILPDLHAIDLRTEEEKANGECYRLSDLVDMGAA